MYIGKSVEDMGKSVRNQVLWLEIESINTLQDEFSGIIYKPAVEG
jgi:hypothetical protein